MTNFDRVLFGAIFVTLTAGGCASAAGTSDSGGDARAAVETGSQEDTSVAETAAPDGGAGEDAGIDAGADAVVVAEASVDARTDASADVSAAGPCVLPNGRTCARGSRCGAGDACNSCTCAADGTLECTANPCAATCGSRADCGADQYCRFEAVDTCGGRGSCQETIACVVSQTYCGCGGTTYMGCAPDRPTLHAGACTGTRPSACALPGGASCPAESSCPAGDGCNVCFCDASGTATCTRRTCM